MTDIIVTEQNKNTDEILVKKTDTCYNITNHFKEQPKLDKLNNRLIEYLIQNIE